MKTLNIVVEGSTEENFVNSTIRPHMAKRDIYVYCRKIRTGWDAHNCKPAKGGLVKYKHFKNDLIRWMEEQKQQNEVYFTSFIDLYAFPLYASPYSAIIQQIVDPYEKVEKLETAIYEDIGDTRFIPYVQLHEFEALLFVSPDKLLELYPDKQEKIKGLKANALGLKPELINEHPQSAPSKRIIQFLPAYKFQKAEVAPLIADAIGLNQLRDACPHFGKWLSKIEQL